MISDEIGHKTYADFKIFWSLSLFLSTEQLAVLDEYAGTRMADSDWSLDFDLLDDDTCREQSIYEPLIRLDEMKTIDPQWFWQALVHCCHVQLHPELRITYGNMLDKRESIKLRREIIKVDKLISGLKDARKEMLSWRGDSKEALHFITGLRLKEYDVVIHHLETIVARFRELFGSPYSRAQIVSPVRIFHANIKFEYDPRLLREELAYECSLIEAIHMKYNRLNQGRLADLAHFMCFWKLESRGHDESYADVGERIRQKVKEYKKLFNSNPDKAFYSPGEGDAVDIRVNWKLGRIEYYPKKRGSVKARLVKKV